MTARTPEPRPSPTEGEGKYPNLTTQLRVLCDHCHQEPLHPKCGNCQERWTAADELDRLTALEADSEWLKTMLKDINEQLHRRVAELEAIVAGEADNERLLADNIKLRVALGSSPERAPCRQPEARVMIDIQPIQLIDPPYPLPELSMADIVAMSQLPKALVHRGQKSSFSDAEHARRLFEHEIGTVYRKAMR